MQLCIAVDIGGTKIAAGLVSADGELVASAKTPTPDTDDAEALFAELITLVETVAGRRSTGLPAARGRRPATRDVTVIACGVGCGGPMTLGGEAVSPLNIPAWRDFPLKARLAEATGVPSFVDNDAKALALGEGWKGAAVGCGDYLAMVVSTGVGGGIVLDRRVLDGAAGNAGHIGHLIVEAQGRQCRCGARGCLEAEASGTAIAAITGRPAAEAGPEVVQRTGFLVGRAVASVANLLDLQLAVVAGSVALGFGEPFFAAAQDEIDRRACLDFSKGTRVVPGGLGPDGPLVGAAAVGWRGLGTDVLSK